VATMPEQLFDLAHAHGIGVEFWDFKPPLEGVYVSHREDFIPPQIGLDKKLRQDKKRLRCILAEELGHHFTTVGSAYSKKFYFYSDRVWTSQIEYRAMKWAGEYLIPLPHIKTALQCGMFQTWELADYFEVTNDFMRFRLALPDVKTLSYYKGDTYGELSKTW